MAFLSCTTPVRVKCIIRSMKLLNVNCVLCAVTRDLKGFEDFRRIKAEDVSSESI